MSIGPADQTQAFLRTIVEFSDDAIVTKTMAGLVTSWNPAAERIFGYTAAEMIGRPITTIFPPDRIDEEADFLRRLARGEHIDHYETVRRRKDGRPIDVSVTLSPLRDPSGAITGASKIAHDITERKRAEARERRQLEWWRVVLASTSEAVIATNADGRIRFMNGGAASLMGVTADEADGQPAASMFRIASEASREPVEDPVSRVLRDGTALAPGHDTLLLARDQERFIEYSAAPILAEDRGVAGAVLMFRDVGERRRAEAERGQLLAAEQAARMEAERATRTKDEFLAAVSHELRTPLNVILGWARMLRSHSLDSATAARALEAIERNAQLQVQLIEDLLDVPRILSGKLRLQVRPIDMVAVVEAARELVEAAARAKGVLIRTCLDDEARSFIGDPDRLQQVVWNLLANAVRFTPPGGRIDIALKRSEWALHLSVSDTGQGIGPDLLPHIFERFRQGPGAAATAGSGLGLGLAIVRHLVQLHGGKVAASSEGEGRGATFLVTLPFVNADLSSEVRDPTRGFPSLDGIRTCLWKTITTRAR